MEWRLVPKVQFTLNPSNANMFTNAVFIYFFYQSGRWTFLCYQIGTHKSWTSKQCPPAKWQKASNSFFFFFLQILKRFPFSFVCWLFISNATLITALLMWRPTLVYSVTIYNAQQTTAKRKVVSCWCLFSRFCIFLLHYDSYVHCFCKYFYCKN